VKSIDLTSGHHDLAEILSLAKSESVLIHAESGDEFLIERADEFDIEVTALGHSTRFMSFLGERSAEMEDLTLAQVREKRGL